MDIHMVHIDIDMVNINDTDDVDANGDGNSDSNGDGNLIRSAARTFKNIFDMQSGLMKGIAM